jgi:hypothetical protein
MEMPADVFEMYWESIRIIDAQEMLRSMTIGDYPNGTRDSRRKIHKQVHQEAYPSTWSDHHPKVTVDQFFGKPRVKHGE